VQTSSKSRLASREGTDQECQGLPMFAEMGKKNLVEGGYLVGIRNCGQWDFSSVVQVPGSLGPASACRLRLQLTHSQSFF
jgi:hypothetical protein